MCDEGFVARMGASVVPRGILAPFAFTGALKGNSPASLVDKGEPVGADRMILGAPSEGAGLCMSCVSFRAWPAPRGGSSRPESSVRPETAGDLDRGLRAMGEELVEPAMVATMMMMTRGNEGESKASSSGEVAWGKVVVAQLVGVYSAMVLTVNLLPSLVTMGLIGILGHEQVKASW